LSSLTRDSIRAVAARGIIVGKETGKYDPQGKLTRAEFVQMLMRLFDAVDSTATSKLTDVKEGAWYYKAVASAEKLGIVQGKTDGSFGINDTLTRQDMAVLLHRAQLVSGYSLPFNDKEVPSFTVGPKSPVNRAEAAVLIHSFLQTMTK